MKNVDDVINEESSFNIPVAKVRKYTPVKEGQQHPVAKGGHLRLFHEHVWPKGYTPERMRQINDLQFGISGAPRLIQSGYFDPPKETTDKLARAVVNKNLAKSTVPIEDLRALEKGGALKDAPLQIDVVPSDIMGEGTVGKYNAIRHSITFPLSDTQTAVDEQRALLHEVGHAVDASKNAKRMFTEMAEIKDDPISSIYGNRPAPPVSEGVAEGYSLGHSRLTRSNKRVGGDISMYGYSPSGWFFPDAGQKFKKTRRDTFNAARGIVPEAPKPTPSKQIEQPGLFD